MMNSKEIYQKIKRNFKNIIFEDIRRLFSHNHIFKIKSHNINTLFYLPDRRDYIEQKIIVDNKFYEQDRLNYVSKFINKNSVVLDVGSNIGNHTLFFSNVLNAKKVYSFEPQKYVFNILKKNVKINHLDQSVELFNLALGESSSNKNIYIPKKKLLRLNFGCARIIDSEKGQTRVLPLDEMKIKEKIDFIKIDTEGFEDKVLNGAKKTIEDDKPIVWIEVKKENMNFVNTYFKKIGYYKSIKIGIEDYLFIHKSNA
jgi:FkbM family methyltransferase